MKRTTLFVLFVFLFFVTNTALGQTPEITDGLNFLSTSQNPDGSWGDHETDIDTVAATAEVLGTLAILNGSGSLEYSEGASWLQLESITTTENLAERLSVNGDNGSDLDLLIQYLDELTSSWGGFYEYESNNLDSVYAINSLQNIGYSDTALIDSSIQKLLDIQNQDGGWGFTEGQESEVYYTALISYLLQESWTIYSHNTSIENAAGFLLGHQNPDGGFGLNESTIIETAYSLLALATTGVDGTVLQNAEDYLISSQQADGSWEGDPYVTALAMRALNYADSPPLNPYLRTVLGRVTDAQTNTPLQGVLVELNGPVSKTLITSNDGKFEFTNLPEGIYSLHITLTGYSSILTDTTIDNQDVDFGDIRLFKQSEATSGTIYGTIVDQENGNPLDSVTITVSNLAEPAYTGPDGKFSLINVPVGQVMVTAAKDGYSSSTAIGDITAGGLMHFSAALVPVETPTTAIQGTITEVNTGLPLTGAVVTISDGLTPSSTNTDESGYYRFSDIAPGPYTIEVSLTGYDNAASSFVLYSNNVIDFSPRMYPEGTTPPGGNLSNVHGMVIDGSTGQPLAGVVVGATFGSETQTLTSDQGGLFNLDTDKIGSGTLSFSHAGYFASEVGLYIEPLSINNLETVSLWRDGLVDLLPDLIVSSIDAQNVNNDPASLELSGQLSVQITNQGTINTPTEVTALAFYDVNANDTYEANEDIYLGQGISSDQVYVGETPDISIDLQGQLPYLDAPIKVWVDSSQNIAELDETNNVSKLTNGCLTLPDLSLSLFTVIDHGENQPLSLSVRVGNGGEVPLSEQTDVLFYNGDPASNGTILGTVSIAGLGADSYTDILLDDVSGITGEEDIYAVIDPDDFIPECNELNNSIQVPVPQLWPDMTISALEVVDNGTGQPFSIVSEIANNGSTSPSKEILVAFYNGDPYGSGVFIGSMLINSVEPHNLVTARLDNVTGLSGDETIYGVVDADDTIEEYNECNNIIQGTFSDIPTLGEIMVSISATQYGPDEDVTVQTQVTNSGTLAGEFVTDIEIDDSDGNLTFDFGSKGPQLIEGGASTTYTDTWNTDTSIAGDYTIHGTVRNIDGTVLNESFITFQLTHPAESGPPISIRTSLEPPSGFTSGTVEITNLVQNGSINKVVPDALLHISVIDGAGQTIFSVDESQGQLLPGALKEIATPFSYTGATPGYYTIISEIIDGTTNESLASEQVQFEIKQDLQKAVTSSVAVSPNALEKNVTQSVTIQLQNVGDLDVTGLQVKQFAAAIDGESEINPQITEHDLSAGGQLTLTRDLQYNVTPGDYEYVVQINIDGIWQTVAYELFTIIRPIADAGEDFTATLGETLHLDGSGSFDHDGDPLNYSWTLIQKPEASSAALVDPLTENPQLVLDVKGDYTVQLIVSDDNNNESLPDTVLIVGNNIKPVANAGPDQYVNIGDIVTLDGSASTDEDGDSLTYSWSIVAIPEGSSSALSDPNSLMPTMEFDSHGTYEFELVVHDGIIASNPDRIALTVDNVKPVAHAGPDQSIYIGEEVILDGSASSDIDGDPLTYHWQIVSKPEGSYSTLSDDTAIMPSIFIDSHGPYEIQLIVNDSYDDSEPDTVLLDVLNVKPIADAGPDQSVYVGDTAVLDGSNSSDADGDPLLYHWNVLSKPDNSQAELTDSESVNPTIQIDELGDYVIQLMVDDTYDVSTPDTVLLSAHNIRPVADAGPDQVLCAGDTVMLDGSNSYDGNGDDITFEWSLLNKPEGSLSEIFDPYNVLTEFQTDIIGDYIAQLIVYDGHLYSEPDTMVVFADNTPPVAGDIEAVSEPLPVGSLINANAEFSFTDFDDSHTAIWDWGDGSTSAGTVVESDGIGSVAGSHTYTTAGVFTVTLTVSDLCNFSDRTYYRYIVIYDPDAGFVTGGGWIQSPAGAYSADSTLSGKANFGFISKYKKGASVPTGQTEFNFNLADLEFHSTSYQWLVIANTKAMYKGEGTINNEGEFGFMLSAIDGDLSGGEEDRFRIKIWDKYTEEVVYDNQFGAGDDADPATVISGGNIAIHK